MQFLTFRYAALTGLAPRVFANNPAFAPELAALVREFAANRLDPSQFTAVGRAAYARCPWEAAINAGPGRHQGDVPSDDTWGKALPYIERMTYEPDTGRLFRPRGGEITADGPIRVAANITPVRRDVISSWLALKTLDTKLIDPLIFAPRKYCLRNFQPR